MTAVLRTMWLGLLRDRGALVMAFVLPITFFLIFAAIFSGATGQQLRLDIAIADEVRNETTARLVAALAADSSLRRIEGDGIGADGVRELVREGRADVGLIVRAGGLPLEDIGGFGEPPLIVVTDPIRGVAGPMLEGRIQRAYFEALPDVALGNVVDLVENEFVELTDAQRSELARGLDDLRKESIEATRSGGSTGWGFEDLYSRERVAGQSGAVHHVAYYAGAIAVLFLLFSCVHGAITLIDERDTGIIDRLLAGPGGTGVLVGGKFLFLTVQGFVQVGVIFVVAWRLYGVDLPAHVLPWAVTTLAASAAAAGLALAIVTACRTRQQAQTIANVTILILSALGGSMVPRFLMPPLLQDLGWLTPNTWALEAYTAVFWRGAPPAECLVPWGALLLTAAVSLVAARAFARRLETI